MKRATCRFEIACSGRANLQVISHQLKEAAPPPLAPARNRRRQQRLAVGTQQRCRDGAEIQAVVGINLKVERRWVSRVAGSQQPLAGDSHATEGAFKDQPMGALAEHLRLATDLQLGVRNGVGYAGPQPMPSDCVEAAQQDADDKQAGQHSDEDCKAADTQATKGRGCIGWRLGHAGTAYARVPLQQKHETQVHGGPGGGQGCKGGGVCWGHSACSIAQGDAGLRMEAGGDTGGGAKEKWKGTRDMRWAKGSKADLLQAAVVLLHCHQ